MTHVEAVSTHFLDSVAGKERGLGLELLRTEEKATRAEGRGGQRSRDNGARGGGGETGRMNEQIGLGKKRASGSEKGEAS